MSRITIGSPAAAAQRVTSAVAIDAPVIDWSSNCGNLSGPVGPFAISAGLGGAPADGIAGSIDLLARIFSMGLLHHAMTGTGAVAIASAAAIPGTVVLRLAPAD